MAREVTKVELYGANNDGNPRSFIVASATAISKGTMLKFADGKIASKSTGTADKFAGIASMKKSGTDFSTRISVWTDGIFNFTSSGVITAGDAVQTAIAAQAQSTGNQIMTIPVTGGDYPAASQAIIDALGAVKVGVALDTVADNERVNVRVDV